MLRANGYLIMLFSAVPNNVISCCSINRMKSLYLPVFSYQPRCPVFLWPVGVTTRKAVVFFVSLLPSFCVKFYCPLALSIGTLRVVVCRLETHLHLHLLSSVVALCSSTPFGSGLANQIQIKMQFVCIYTCTSACSSTICSKKKITKKNHKSGPLLVGLSFLTWWHWYWAEFTNVFCVLFCMFIRSQTWNLLSLNIMEHYFFVSHCRPSKESQHSPVVSNPPHCPAPQRQLIVTHPARHCQTTQPGVLGSLIQ